MHTIYCFTHLTHGYDSHAEYDASKITCHVFIEPDRPNGCKCGGEIFAVPLSDLFGKLDYVVSDKSRYRMFCNHGQLVIRNSDLLECLELGHIGHREIKSQYLNRESGDVESHQSILSAVCDYPLIVAMEYLARKTEVTVIDCANYGIDWDTMLEYVNGDVDQSDEMPLYKSSKLGILPAEGLLVLHHLLDRYRDLCKRCMLGRPALTYASQGQASYYIRADAVPIRQTGNTAALNLEISAYRGGVVRANGYGRYKGECHLWDISACYPYHATIRRVPFALSQYYANPCPETVEKCVRYYYCIAKVRLDSSKAIPRPFDVPFKHDADGVYAACVHDWELKELLSCDVGLEVVEIAAYQSDTILAANAAHLLGIRTTAERNGQKLTAHYAKVIANGYHGKLGSRMGLWVDIDGIIPPGPNAHWTQRLASGGPVQQLRSVGYRVQIRRDDLIPYQSSVAIAGALTAYGRETLLSLIDYCGESHVLHCCTDSLIVDEVGNRRLSFLGQHKQWLPGGLRSVESSTECIVAGIGLYCIGAREARQGYASGTTTGGSVAGLGGSSQAIRGLAEVEAGYDPRTTPYTKSYAAVMQRACDTPWKRSV